jgi:hypothetical protein
MAFTFEELGMSDRPWTVLFSCKKDPKTGIEVEFRVQVMAYGTVSAVNKANEKLSDYTAANPGQELPEFYEVMAWRD